MQGAEAIVVIVQAKVVAEVEVELDTKDIVKNDQEAEVKVAAEVEARKEKVEVGVGALMKITQQRKLQEKGQKDGGTSKSEKAKDRGKKGPETKSQTKTKKDSEKEQVQSKNNRKEPSKIILENNKGKTSVKERKTEQSPETSVKPLRHKSVVEDSSAVGSKDLKVSAPPDVFLPRNVSRTVGKIGKGIQLAHGRPLKPHPMFAPPEENEIEEPKKPESPVTEENKKRKSHFNREVDKVFNAKPWPKVKEEKGMWTRVWPETSPGDEN